MLTAAMFRRWRDRRLGRSVSRQVEAAGATAVVDDAMLCATQLQSLGDEIDLFRRRGEAAFGGETGPEVQTLRDRQNEIVRQFFERTLQVKRDDREALDDAYRRLGEMYRDARGDLVTGRALGLVEAVLRRDEL
jgi:hypothetical protein